jgi:galactonate dehydratase
VKVETDEGLVGWGEATLEWKPKGVVGCIEDLSPLAIGQDPRRTEFLWQILYRQFFIKPGIVALAAISGIDQACWDIHAQSLGVPLYQLLGGAVRDRVRMYDHLEGRSNRERI